MSRNDGYLHSGMQPPVRQKQIEAKKEEAKLDPKAEMVLTEIAKLKAETLDIKALVLDDTIDDSIKLRKIERMKDRYEDLNMLEARMKRLLGGKA